MITAASCEKFVSELFKITETKIVRNRRRDADPSPSNIYKIITNSYIL